MIIIDLNQVMLSNLHMQLQGHTNVTVEESLFRHMVLNSIRSYKSQFGRDYGELVIACDSGNYWRKQLFPYYKARRKLKQKESELDWPAIFKHLNKIRDELKEVFPYPVIQVETAEADDVIATLAIDNFQRSEKTLILSKDKDFRQLQQWRNVKQYDPIGKVWMHEEHPDVFLLFQIINGDSGDDIPNILSADNCFMIKERQKRMTQKRLAFYSETSVELYDDVAKRGWYRNQALIDLRQIPESIKSKIREQYILQSGKKRDKLMNYFIEKKLRNLFEHMSEF